MKNVEILLRDHVEDLGRCGEVVRVRPGYARNYLFPRNLATLANDENKRVMERRAKKLDLLEVQHIAAQDARAVELEAVTLQTSSKADADGHLFGSVNAAHIAQLLRDKGHQIADKDVRMDAPLKQVGTHKVKVHLHKERSAEITVIVDRA